MDELPNRAVIDPQPAFGEFGNGLGHSSEIAEETQGTGVEG
jgi:hypothetical protein